jgi:hypothetical protein
LTTFRICELMILMISEGVLREYMKIIIMSC